MTSTRIKITFLFVVIVLFSSMQYGNAISCELVHVSIPKGRFAEDERIVAFTASIVAGGVFAFPNVPMGWSITIYNDPSWKTSINGTIIVGAAALDTRLAPVVFDHFLTIEEEPNSDVPFDVTLEIVTTTDFVKLKTLSLKRSELILESEVIQTTRCLDPKDEEQSPKASSRPRNQQ